MAIEALSSQYSAELYKNPNNMFAAYQTGLSGTPKVGGSPKVEGTPKVAGGQKTGLASVWEGFTGKMAVYNHGMGVIENNPTAVPGQLGRASGIGAARFNAYA